MWPNGRSENPVTVNRHKIANMSGAKSRQKVAKKSPKSGQIICLLLKNHSLISRIIFDILDIFVLSLSPQILLPGQEAFRNLMVQNKNKIKIIFCNILTI
jgi:hypothetical protein